MTRFTQKTSHSLFRAAFRNVTLALFLVVFGASIALAQSKAYVTNIDDNTVSVIDTATNTVTATVPVGLAPQGIVVTPDGAFAYVATLSGTVSVISAATNTVVATVPVGPTPFGVAITPDGASVYVTDFDDDTIRVISTATNTVTATIPVADTSSAPSSVRSVPSSIAAHSLKRKRNR
jgi:YVTN family beta-propeller protein